MSISYPSPTNHFDANELDLVSKRDIASYTNRPSIYIVLFNDENLVATINYRADVGRIYPLPGGGVDAGESFEEGLVREVREEIGCEIKEVKQLGSFASYDDSTNRCFQSVICSAKLDGEIGIAKPAEDYEQGSKLVWITMEELLNKLESLAGPIDARKDDRSRSTLRILEGTI
jgi:8-oxo-dGTP pyrophosphatase MutT (NUDIX family)